MASILRTTTCASLRRALSGASLGAAAHGGAGLAVDRMSLRRVLSGGALGAAGHGGAGLAVDRMSLRRALSGGGLGAAGHGGAGLAVDPMSLRRALSGGALGAAGHCGAGLAVDHWMRFGSLPSTARAFCNMSTEDKVISLLEKNAEQNAEIIQILSRSVPGAGVVAFTKESKWTRERVKILARKTGRLGKLFFKDEGAILLPGLYNAFLEEDFDYVTSEYILLGKDVWIATKKVSMDFEYYVARVMPYMRTALEFMVLYSVMHVCNRGYLLFEGYVLPWMRDWFSS